MSTANHAEGYWSIHALSSASIPSGGMPWRTLAMKPHPGGHRRSASVQRNIRGFAAKRFTCSTASSKVTQTGRFGIGIGNECRQVLSKSNGSVRRMYHRCRHIVSNPRRRMNEVGIFERILSEPSCPLCAALSSCRTGMHPRHPNHLVDQC